MNESEVPAPRAVYAHRNASTLPPELETHIPGPARLPSEFANTERPTELDGVAERLAALSDELNDENGLVHRLFADLNRKGAKREHRAQRRHYQMMKVLRHISTGLVDVSARLTRIEFQHGNRLTIVEGVQARARGGE